MGTSCATTSSSPPWRPAAAPPRRGRLRASGWLSPRQSAYLRLLPGLRGKNAATCVTRVILPGEAQEGAVVADAASTARSMWTLFEPVHAVTYFAPEARSAYERAGLRGFWRGYFAGRAAPLGPVSAAVVTASFFNFAPAFVARAIPDVWELITPDEALRIRMAGATEALRGLLAGRDAEAAAAADLLWRAIGELDFSGRVLAAAGAALPVPDDGSSCLARLWQAATVLREHR